MGDNTSLWIWDRLWDSENYNAVDQFRVRYPQNRTVEVKKPECRSALEWQEGLGNSKK